MRKISAIHFFAGMQTANEENIDCQVERGAADWAGISPAILRPVR
jgi:hypothetical protein